MCVCVCACVGEIGGDLRGWVKVVGRVVGRFKELDGADRVHVRLKGTTEEVSDTMFVDG